MRLDGDAPVLLLSPHLDDAVLSCWSVLTGSREVVVVNVFSGIPEPGLLTPVDRLAGATDSATRMRERLAEDAEALALAGGEPIDLGFLDSQYRPVAGEPGAAEIVAALDGPVERASALFAPAGLSGNPDHLVVRELALGLAAGGYPTELYAEFPAAIRYGWPHWVTGDDPIPTSSRTSTGRRVYRILGRRESSSTHAASVSTKPRPTPSYAPCAPTAPSIRC